MSREQAEAVTRLMGCKAERQGISAAMAAARLLESRQQIKDGKGVRLSLDDISPGQR